MVIHHPKDAHEAVNLRKAIPNSLYLAGGTENLRLNGTANEETELIDINGLGFDKIEVAEDGMLHIGSRVTLQQIVACELVPSFIREACRFCSSFERRNQATIGGNVASRRDDSYLLAALAAADVSFWSITPHGDEFKKVADYALSKCRRFIAYFVIDPKRKGSVKRFGLTATSHAALIAAESEGRYALSVKGSPLAIGDSPELWKEMTFQDDPITGSASYKKYLASIVFEKGAEA